MASIRLTPIMLQTYESNAYSLPDQERKVMGVLFQPRFKPKEGEPMQLAQFLKMTVLHNPFDATVFRLSGTYLSHDVLFEDLPEGAVADELVFDQVSNRVL